MQKEKVLRYECPDTYTMLRGSVYSHPNHSRTSPRSEEKYCRPKTPTKNTSHAYLPGELGTGGSPRLHAKLNFHMCSCSVVTQKSCQSSTLSNIPHLRESSSETPQPSISAYRCSVCESLRRPVFLFSTGNFLFGPSMFALKTGNATKSLVSPTSTNLSPSILYHVGSRSIIGQALFLCENSR
jgi:hypothetical protein